jgi:hypothetical protein
MWGSRYFMKSASRCRSNHDCGHGFLLENISRQRQINNRRFAWIISEDLVLKVIQLSWALYATTVRVSPRPYRAKAKKLPSVIRNSLCQCNWRVRATLEREQQHTRPCVKLFTRKQPTALKSRCACSCVIIWFRWEHTHTVVAGWNPTEGTHDCPFLCYCAMDWQHTYLTYRVSKRFGIL